MKHIFKTIGLTLVAAAPLALTGCLEEVFPTSGVTEEQLGGSDKAVETIFWGMPSYLNKFATVSSSYAYDWGYGSIIHIRDVMTGDYTTAASSYDWYTSWAYNRYNDERYASTGFVWAFYNTWMLTINQSVKTFKPADGEEPEFPYYYAASCAFRAFASLDLARMYEFLPNDAVSGVNQYGNDVTGLTVPIVTEETTEEEAIDNPRATREQMAAHILADLREAEKYIGSYNNQSNKTVPDLAVVYGLYARYYMWLEDYPNAAEYARKAIDASPYATPLTEDQWLSLASGFNDMTVNSWMLAEALVEENDAVQTGILNWTSWMSNEATYGYANAGPYQRIDASLYSRIDNADFRKLSYLAPEGHLLEGQEPMIDDELRSYLPAYSSLKFRPGFANTKDFNIGSSVQIPLMRVEEMYLIEAEATAHTNAAAGKELIESFMQRYRYSSYVCEASSTDEVVEEIVLQKRIELWGEGQTFFDIKRLDMPVTRNYSGTNFPAGSRFNTTTRPAWMNLIIVRNEGANNTAVLEWNNPRTEGVYN